MRLNHIYITKEGEPMANPYQDAPQFSAWDMLSPATQTDKLIKEYHSGLLPFEDRDQVLREVTNKCKCIDVEHCKWAEKCYLSDKPDTLIPVDLEVEVVEVCANCGKPRMEHSFSFKPKKVLRIKP